MLSDVRYKREQSNGTSDDNTVIVKGSKMVITSELKPMDLLSDISVSPLFITSPSLKGAEEVLSTGEIPDFFRMEPGDVTVETAGADEVQKVTFTDTVTAVNSTDNLIETTIVLESSPPLQQEEENWFKRLTEGLNRSSVRLTQGIVNLLTKRKLDQVTLQELEELLITSDFGVDTASSLITTLAKDRFGKEVSIEKVHSVLATEIMKILEPIEQPLIINRLAKPYVILIVGVNGAGKTTTIGKMAHLFCKKGFQVSLAAGDTFRAAAAEQLRIWGGRSRCRSVFIRSSGSDAAGVIFDALKEAIAHNDDVLLIDTAGRLQNKIHLMAELQKIVRVLRKIEQIAPHACLLVLDATVGQSLHAQVESFKQLVEISGLVLTKLDGTAKGGALVALAEKFKIPIHYVSVGEGIEDLSTFSAYDFSRSLLGLTKLGNNIR